MKALHLTIALFVLLMSPIATSAQSKSATFHKIWLEHNVMRNGEKCLAIHVDVTASGMKGKTLKCVAYVYSPKETKHKDTNSKYHTKDGQVSASTKRTCSYDASRFRDLVIYLPNDEIHPFKGKHSYYVKVNAFDNGEILGKSDYAHFAMTGTGNNGSSPNNGAVASGNGSTKMPCFACNGTGAMVCVGCLGSGMRRSYTLDCMVTCEACLGTGRYPCAACGGKGYFVVPGASSSGGGNAGGYSGGGYPGGVYSGGVYSGGSIGGSSSSSSSSSVGRTCPGCNGTGKGPDKIMYRPNYTGETKYEYCSICGRNMDAHHYHLQGTCTVCGGSGTVKY